jgi:DNA repair protein RecO (recombination protein O)
MPQPPRVYETPAIVLRQRKLGEADKVITLYSANFGKLDAVAKGVRKATSRLAGHVEPLNHGSFLLAHGRTLDIITQAQTIESFQPLRADLDRLSRGLYAAELVDRFTEERSENFALYRALLDALRRLSERDDLELVLRFFEMTLLDMLGYRPELHTCIACGRPLEPVANAWAAGAGGVVCPNCQHDISGVRPLSVNALKLLRLFQGQHFAEVARVHVSPELAEELEGHLRDSIHHALERDVRSAHFVETLRRSHPAPAPPVDG